MKDELYLPEEVVFSYNSKLIEPTFDEDFVFIKKVIGGKIVEVKINEKKYNNCSYSKFKTFIYIFSPS